jgi:hypothetical protein
MLLLINAATEWVRFFGLRVSYEYTLDLVRLSSDTKFRLKLNYS